MKKIVCLLGFLGAVQMASAQETTIQWVGQFPPEQAQPVVDAFNSGYGPELGFFVEYKFDDTAVADLLSGKARPEYDIVHMKDADMLNTLAQKGLSTPLTLKNKNLVPAHVVDAQNRWTGILKRARIIYYNPEFVNASDLQTYEDLGKEQFKDKLCLRQKKAQYNIGLYSFFLGVWGKDKTASVLKSWADNSAALPLLEKDLDHVIAKVESGECTVGVANTYYFMRHLRTNPTSKVKAVLPNQQDVGAHINVDGVAVLKDAKNQAFAQEFANWLLTEEAQMTLSEFTDKFPVNPAVETAVGNQFGTFKEATSFDLNKITSLKDEALTLATEQGLK